MLSARARKVKFPLCSWDCFMQRPRVTQVRLFPATYCTTLKQRLRDGSMNISVTKLSLQGELSSSSTPTSLHPTAKERDCRTAQSRTLKICTKSSVTFMRTIQAWSFFVVTLSPGCAALPTSLIINSTIEVYHVPTALADSPVSSQSHQELQYQLKELTWIRAPTRTRNPFWTFLVQKTSSS